MTNLNGILEDLWENGRDVGVEELADQPLFLKDCRRKDVAAAKEALRELWGLDNTTPSVYNATREQ